MNIWHYKSQKIYIFKTAIIPMSKFLWNQTFNIFICFVTCFMFTYWKKHVLKKIFCTIFVFFSWKIINKNNLLILGLNLWINVYSSVMKTHWYTVLLHNFGVSGSSIWIRPHWTLLSSISRPLLLSRLFPKKTVNTSHSYLLICTPVQPVRSNRM